MTQARFLFNLSNIQKYGSDIAYITRQLGALSEQLVQEERTLCHHLGGRAENVAEHSFMLSLIAPIIAEEYYPHLNANLISRYCTVHDIVEAYVGDTPTYDISSEDLRFKEQNERRGLMQLKKEFTHLPKFVVLIEEYEKQENPEARFVRLLDKWMPLVLHIANRGFTVKGYLSKEKIYQNAKVNEERLKSQYPEFVELIDIRTELAYDTARSFLKVAAGR